MPNSNERRPNPEENQNENQSASDVIPQPADGGLPTAAPEKSGPDGGLSAPADSAAGQEPLISKANSDDPDPNSEIRVYDGDVRNIRGLGKRRPLGRERDSFWGVEANAYLLDDSDEWPGESSLELKQRFQKTAEAPPPWLTTEARTFPGYHAPERIFGPRPKPAAPIPPRSGLLLMGQVELPAEIPAPTLAEATSASPQAAPGDRPAAAAHAGRSVIGKGKADPALYRLIPKQHIRNYFIAQPQATYAQVFAYLDEQGIKPSSYPDSWGMSENNCSVEAVYNKAVQEKDKKQIARMQTYVSKIRGDMGLT